MEPGFLIKKKKKDLLLLSFTGVKARGVHRILLLSSRSVDVSNMKVNGLSGEKLNSPCV